MSARDACVAFVLVLQAAAMHFLLCMVRQAHRPDIWQALHHDFDHLKHSVVAQITICIRLSSHHNEASALRIAAC